MNAAAWAPAVLRSRIGILPSPPRGTSSRILKNRLDRTSRRSFANHVSDSSSSWATLADAAVRRESRIVTPSKEVRPEDEVMLLRNILLAIPKPRPANAHSNASTTTESAMTTSREHAVRLTTSDQRLDFILQTMRAKDTNTLYNWLTNPVVALSSNGHEKYVDEAQLSEERTARAEAVAHLPPVVFAEVLRMLDPYVVSKKIDALADIAISPSMAQLTPLGAGVDIFGIRILYRRLLHTLLSICALRAEALGQSGTLLLNDYIVLMRAAGAASDTDKAKRIWKDMITSGYMDMRHDELYAEFIRARFLTESLYVQHDPVRMRVQAVNLHRQKMIIHYSRLYNLERMRIRAERGMLHRFGQNSNSPDHAEHLTRILRRRKPLQKVYTKAFRRGHGQDERVMAAAIVGFGRNSSIYMIGDILALKWGVHVTRIPKSNTYNVEGSTIIPLSSPLYPSAVLLDAVVQAYCCNSKIDLALQVVTHLSHKYQVKIPDRTWFDLLNWAYALSSSQVEREWLIAGIPSRTTPPDTVKRIWKVMTSAPYNVKPGLEQYNILIKSMLNNDSSILPALQLMRQLKPLYQAQLRKQEEAMQLVAETRTLRHRDRGAAAFHLQRVIAEKWRMWYYFHSWCLRIFKNGARAEPGGELLARLIPKVIDEFRPFVQRYTWYPTPTGTVTLREPHNHSKVVSEKIAYKMPIVRPSLRFRYRNVSELDEDDPNGEPPPADNIDTEFFSGSAITKGIAKGSGLQAAATGAATDSDSMEEYKVKIDIDNIANDSVVDKYGNVLTPEQLRWYDRRLVRVADLRRVVMRQRAIPNRLVNHTGSLSKHRDSLVREFT